MRIRSARLHHHRHPVNHPPVRRLRVTDVLKPGTGVISDVVQVADIPYLHRHPVHVVLRAGLGDVVRGAAQRFPRRMTSAHNIGTPGHRRPRGSGDVRVEIGFVAGQHHRPVIVLDAVLAATQPRFVGADRAVAVGHRHRPVRRRRQRVAVHATEEEVPRPRIQPVLARPGRDPNLTVTARFRPGPIRIPGELVLVVVIRRCAHVLVHGAHRWASPDKIVCGDRLHQIPVVHPVDDRTARVHGLTRKAVRGVVRVRRRRATSDISTRELLPVHDVHPATDFIPDMTHPQQLRHDIHTIVREPIIGKDVAGRRQRRWPFRFCRAANRLRMQNRRQPATGAGVRIQPSGCDLDSVDDLPRWHQADMVDIYVVTGRRNVELDTKRRLVRSRRVLNSDRLPRAVRRETHSTGLVR